MPLDRRRPWADLCGWIFAISRSRDLVVHYLTSSEAVLSMHDERFFRSTRGLILQALRKRRLCTIDDLSESLGLTPNAIRQHVAVLERDGFVRQESVRRGRFKPCHAYSLTGRGDDLFPKRYQALLSDLLREVSESEGPEKISGLLDRWAQRQVEREYRRFDGKPLSERVALLANLLNTRGLLAEHEERDGVFVIKGFNCPFGRIPEEYPQICSAGVQVMELLLAAPVEQVSSLQNSGDCCSFTVPVHEA